MITIFNRSILRVTRDLNELNEVCMRLKKNKIDYKISTNSITNPGRHHGIPNINLDAAYQYIVYIHKKDVEKVKGV